MAKGDVDPWTRFCEKLEGQEELRETGSLRYMDVEQFVKRGYLMELNRRFLHPLGLALEVTIDEEGAWLSGIWDCRDDPDGVIFEDPPNRELVLRVSKEIHQKHLHREERFGWAVQPMGE